MLSDQMAKALNGFLNPAQVLQGVAHIVLRLGVVWRKFDGPLKAGHRLIHSLQ